MRLFVAAVLLLLVASLAHAQTYTLVSDPVDTQANYARVAVDGVPQPCSMTNTCLTDPDINGNRNVISGITSLVPGSLIFTVTASVCDANDVCSPDTVKNFDCNQTDCEVLPPIPVLVPPTGLGVTVN